MFDVQDMAVIGTIQLRAGFPWLHAAGMTVLLELVVWLTAAAGVGTLLSWLRSLAAMDRPGRARPPAARATPLRARSEGRSPVPEAIAAAALAALLLAASAASASGRHGAALGQSLAGAPVSRTTSVDTATR